jgi:hypothetical protein
MDNDKDQCAAMAMKPYYSEFATFTMQNGYVRGQCSRKATVGSLCTQHEKIRLTDIRIEERTARMKARWAAR